MKKKILSSTGIFTIFIMLASLMLCFGGCSNIVVIKQSLSYEESVDNFLNPNQGFYRTACIAVTKSGVEDKSYIIKDEFQIYHLRMDISAFSSITNGNEDILITQEALNQIENLINIFFQQGKNVILRFAYDKGFNGIANQEPNIEIIFQHIEQICQIVNKFPYTVSAIEAGMIGPWGEMHSSNIATPTIISGIIETYLNNTETTPILVRTPKMIYDYLGITIDQLDTYIIPKNSKAYRLGVFNDGYLGSDSDLGTYQDRTKEIAWLAKQTSHLPFGGEVVRPDSPLHNIQNCLPEMEQINLSYLNYEWNDQIVQNQWQTQKYNSNCGNETLYFGKSAYEYIRNHLGYRFVLKNSTFLHNKQTNNLQIDIELKNVGFGQLNHIKDLTVIFAKNNVAEKTFDCGRFDGSSKLTLNIPLNQLFGNFDVYLLIDNTQNNTHCYPLQFANDLWNNDLNANKIGQINIL